MSTTIPAFIAKRSVRKICVEVFSRALIGFSVALPLAIALGLADRLQLAALVATIAGIAAGIALGASLVERKL